MIFLSTAKNSEVLAFPTAMSPPYLKSKALKQIEIKLSVACMMNGARPSAIQGSTTLRSSRKFFFFSLSTVFLPKRKWMTQAADIACDITVASALDYRLPLFSNFIILNLNCVLRVKLPLRTKKVILRHDIYKD